MPVDHDNLSVTQNVDTDILAGKPYIYDEIVSVQIVAPAAATTFTWSLKDGSEVPFDKQEKHGTAVSFETNAQFPVGLIADRVWQLIVNHAGAAAQTVEWIIEWEPA